MTITMKFNSMFEINTVTGVISGDTYKSKDWIKDSFKATYDKATKTWRADTAKIAAELASDYYKKFIVRVDDAAEKAQPVSHSHSVKSGICPICHTYCDGDCTANRR